MFVSGNKDECSLLTISSLNTNLSAMVGGHGRHVGGLPPPWHPDILRYTPYTPTL